MTPVVRWEDCPPPPDKTPVQRWDEWFNTVGDEESLMAWRAAKSVFTDPVRLDTWASMIELNRLGRLEKEETPQGPSP